MAEHTPGPWYYQEQSDAYKVLHRYICAPIYHYEKFKLKCGGCGLPETAFAPNFKAMVERWNTRIPLAVKIAQEPV